MKEKVTPRYTYRSRKGIAVFSVVWNRTCRRDPVVGQHPYEANHYKNRSAGPGANRVTPWHPDRSSRIDRRPCPMGRYTVTSVDVVLVRENFRAVSSVELLHSHYVRKAGTLFVALAEEIMGTH